MMAGMVSQRWKMWLPVHDESRGVECVVQCRGEYCNCTVLCLVNGRVAVCRPS